MRLNNKVLYSTDIHPNGYKPPAAGQTVRHEPKVSLEKQFAICIWRHLSLLVRSWSRVMAMVMTITYATAQDLRRAIAQQHTTRRVEVE